MGTGHSLQVSGVEAEVHFIVFICTAIQWRLTWAGHTH